jgi:hypothetical protein
MAVTGTYNIQIETPMGTMPARLILDSDGGSLRGSISAEIGVQSFQGGSVSNDGFAFSMTMDSPMGAMKLDFSGTVRGDAVSGQVQTSFGVLGYKGTRAL